MTEKAPLQDAEAVHQRSSTRALSSDSGGPLLLAPLGPDLKPGVQARASFRSIGMSSASTCLLPCSPWLCTAPRRRGPVSLEGRRARLPAPLATPMLTVTLTLWLLASKGRAATSPLMRRRDRRRRMRGARQQHDEFLAAVAREQVFLTEAAATSRRTRALRLLQGVRRCR